MEKKEIFGIQFNGSLPKKFEDCFEEEREDCYISKKVFHYNDDEITFNYR